MPNGTTTAVQVRGVRGKHGACEEDLKMPRDEGLMLKILWSYALR